MEIASFEPVIGQTYDISNMTLITKGIFRGFIQKVRSAELYGEQVDVPVGNEPLMLFEIVHPPGSVGGYRYAGVHVGTFYELHLKKVRFVLMADHFGNSVDQIERHGPQSRRYWKKV